MGGIQVIFCGDFFQLPPVSTADSNKTQTSNIANTNKTQPISIGENNKTQSKQIRFCFQSLLWNQLIQHSYELKQVYRQNNEDNFITILNYIRSGEYPEQCQQVLKTCIGRKLDCQDGILPTQIFTHK